MNNKNGKKFPKSALSLYVKLFCKKRGSKIKDHHVLMKATESWLSLDKNDKQKFLNKYNEYQNNIKMAFADYLKQAEPYLKVKNETKVNPEKDIIQETITTQKIENEEIEADLDQDQNNEINFEINHKNIDSDPVASPQNDLHYDDSQVFENIDSTNHMIQDTYMPIVEPTPPKFTTGQQLYNMINNDENITWANLNINQKRKYQSAVSKIKRKYITEYRNYLEQLPSKELFKYYKDIEFL